MEWQIADFGNTRANTVAMRAHFWSLADEGAIEMGDLATALANQ